MRIVPSLDKVEDGDAGLGLRGKAMAVEQLTLDSGEEALTHRVIVAVPDSSHRRPDPGLLAALAKGQGSVLASMIGMVNHGPRSTLPQSHVQCIEHQLGA